MKNRKITVDVVRSWKDSAYRATLSSNDLARIPAIPVGMAELDPNELGAVAGAKTRSCRRCGLVTRLATRPPGCARIAAQSQPDFRSATFEEIFG